MAKKFMAVLVAAAAAATLVPCTDTGIADPDPLAALKSQDAEQQASIRPAMLVPPFADPATADQRGFRAAMDADRPFIYGITPGGGSRAICETGLVVPTGAGVGTWYSNVRGPAPIAGTAMSKQPADVSGCSGDGPGPDPGLRPRTGSGRAGDGSCGRGAVHLLDPAARRRHLQRRGADAQR